jgi:hypothetical protein
MMQPFKKYNLLLLLCLSATTVNAQKYVTVRRLPFNSASKEFAPAFFGNGIVFCSDKKNDVILSYTDLSGNPYTNLYQVDQKKPGKFDNPRLLSRELTTILHEGPSSFTRDNNTIYFTRNIDLDLGVRYRQREDTALGIFSAQRVNGEWANITPFRFNRLNYNNGFPCISDDGNLLFFCSDNPEGLGGYDIYVSTLKNGIWGQPENLGSNVNTSRHEVFPFYHASGRLYFASRGHNNKGDLDVYFTVNIDGTWQKPVALENPVNSPDDDYGLIWNAAMDTGYFVSDRAGSDDIFLLGSNIPTFRSCAEQEENDYCFLFYEPNNNELDTTTFAYEWDLGDGTRIRSLKAEHCFAGPGTYFVQLNVVDKLTKEIALSQASDSFLVEDIEQPFITASDTVFTGNASDFSGAKTYLPQFETSGYFWDFDDGFRSEGIQTSHRFHFPGTYYVQLGVAGVAASPDDEIPSYCVTRRVVVINAVK